MQDNSEVTVHTFSLRVYMEDTDAQARVYYANYLKFAERARTEFLTSRGISHATLMKEGMMFVVHSCLLKCHAAAQLSEILCVQTQVIKIGGVTFTLRQSIFREETPIATLEIGLAFVNTAGKPIRFPKMLRQILEREASPAYFRVKSKR